MRDDKILFSCHHMAEIYLRADFETKFGQTTGPNVPFFKKFQDSWSTIDRTNFQSGVADRLVVKALRGEVDELLFFARGKLNDQHCREDYREFLELVVIFLGEVPPRGVSFRVPGAMHQARWMAKSLHSLKIFLFRNVYPLSSSDLKSCREICIFLVKFDIKI